MQLCAARTPKPRRARFRALRLRSAPGRLTAPPCAHFLANYETNGFYWPAKAQFQPLEAHPKWLGTATKAFMRECFKGSDGPKLSIGWMKEEKKRREPNGGPDGLEPD